MARQSPRHPAPQPIKVTPPAVSSAPAPAWLHTVVLALAALTLLACFSGPFQSNDGWWHLEMGRFIGAHHGLPVPDPFSFATDLGSPAYAGETTVRHFNLTHEWLAEVFFYWIYLAGGYAGVVLFRALVLMAACAVASLIVWRRTRRFYLAVFAALAPAAVLYVGAADRPQIFTILFTVVFIAILDARRPLWLLPVLSLIWANCHGGFIMGWVVCGAYCADALYTRLRAADAAVREPWDRSLRLWSLAAIADSLLNPNGLGVHTTLLEYRHSRMLSVIGEWRPTILWPPNPFGALLVAGALALLWARRKARVSDLLLFGLFGFAGIYAYRNIYFVALLAPIVVASYWPKQMRPLPAAAEFAMALLIVAAGAARIITGPAFQFNAFEATRPSGAADFLLQHHITGRIYNNLEHGGYLMWRLWPNNQVFVDGRLLNETAFGDYRLLTYNLQAGKPPLQILDDYGIPTVVLTGFEYLEGEPHWLALALANPAQTTWKLVYRDTTASVFMRQPPPGIQPLNSLEAITALGEQCTEHIRAVPSEPGCAKGMQHLYERFNDTANARRWLAYYLEHKVAADPQAERQYQMMLTSGR
jgi:hypothetical protein